MSLKTIFTILTAVGFTAGNAQVATTYKYWTPATDSLRALEGQAWPNQVKDYYDRLPASAEKNVRSEVWDLSKNSAGLQLRFQTNAKEIVVKYIAPEAREFRHMPATGVSGVDLYSKTIDGDWLWASGRYSFGDTITYRFGGLSETDQHVSNREYTLYLPLYNSVKWLQIAVPQESTLKPVAPSTDLPVIVYGTSIAQGGCATRPGLAWTNILSRKIGRPVINLGFSGNGRLEKELTDLLAGVEAKLYVLDCLPNLVGDAYAADLKTRIVNSVMELRQKRPATPILLTQHDGYTEEGINPSRKKEYQAANTLQQQVFDSLSAASIQHIYLLTKEEIGQDIESMVDGTHPNDIGMMNYANAYEKKIRLILNEPVGSIVTERPVTQRRDANIYDWETRHNQVMQTKRATPPGLVLIGNSITHYWAGQPAAPIARGEDSWKKYFDKRKAVNMGFGWDRVENVLWRVYHGELDSITPKQIVLMIGTNNLGLNTNEEIVEGLKFLIKAIQVKQPAASILLMGIFPRRKMEERVVQINRLIATIADGGKVKFADAGKLLLQTDAKIDEGLFTDGLHPNAMGYEKLGAFIDAQLSK